MHQLIQSPRSPVILVFNFNDYLCDMFYCDFWNDFLKHGLLEISLATTRSLFSSLSPGKSYQTWRNSGNEWTKYTSSMKAL